MTDNIIHYEQPLNEYLRVCLRLEHLFQQAQHFTTQASLVDTRAAITAILEILNILERPDLKTRWIKALSQHALRLSSLEHAPDIDHKKLKDLLANLDRLIDYLHSIPSKLGQGLRDNEFLNSIRVYLNKPGGLSDFNCPAYYFWLQQTPEQRSYKLLKWFQELEQVKIIVTVLLQLIRENTSFQLKFAMQGFYQETLDASIAYQMIRISLPIERKVFPEINFGRNRLAIHFVTPSFDTRPVRATHEIQFKLACCAI